MSEAAGEGLGAGGGIGTILAEAAHDIRTPLVSLLGLLELAKSERDDEVRRGYLEGMTVSGQSLLGIVNDILDYVKPEVGGGETRVAPCDPLRLVRSVLAPFEPEAAARGLRLKRRLDVPPSVSLDEGRLARVLRNLVGNALKFTDRGTVTLSLAFSPADARRGTLVLSVRDTGIGIAPADQARVMRPFVRAGDGDRGGSGLGLAICRRLVEQMGGELTLTSEPGKGSVFTVTLPDVAYGEAREAPPSAPAPADCAGLSVLIVDDFELNRAVAEATCRSLGVGRTVAVASAAEALGRLRGGERFDLVLTDVKMRGMDGVELAQAIRRDLGLAGMTVYFLTADGEAFGQAEAAGADGCLLKPVTREELCLVLSDVVERRGRSPRPTNEPGTVGSEQPRPTNEPEGIGDGCPRPAGATHNGGKTP